MRAAEIADLAYDAGIRTQSDLQAAVAIALAESAGDPNAVGDVALQNATWGPSLGLWQIRSLKAETGKGTTRDANKLKDPKFNAKAMYEISGGGKNWGPWTTWPLRAAAYMPQAIGAATGTLAGRSVSTGADVVQEAVTPDGIQDIAEAVRASNRWVSDRNNLFRVAKVMIGSVLIVGGVVLVAKPVVVPAVSKVGKLAGKAL